MDVLDELAESGMTRAEGCDHAPEKRGRRSHGAFAVDICDPERGGCGVELGTTGARRVG